MKNFTYECRKGTNNSRAKLTDDDVREIRKARESVGASKVPRDHPCSSFSLAQRYGLTTEYISAIVRRVRWGHVL